MATGAARPAKSRRKTVRETVPDTPDPVDIAMAAAASGKPLPDAARSVLEKHARLIDCQARLTNAQCAELRLRKIGEGVRAALWAMLAILAFVLLALIVAVVVRAARSDALIVQSFRVPPALAAKGFTGEIVATQVLDKLAEMQRQTESTRPASTYANNWEDDLSIDIPNTGTTTDQLWKLVRGWLGKETRISGEVVEIGEALALTTRVGANPGQRFVSDQADLDALVTKGAELIYKETQPYRYSVYLGRFPDRRAERLAVTRQLTKHSSAVERKWAFNGIAVELRLQGDLRGSMAAARRALLIDPNMLTADANLSTIYLLLGWEQQMIDAIEQGRRLRVSDEYDPQNAVRTRCNMMAVAGIAIPNPEAIREAVACLSNIDDPSAAQSEALNRTYYAIYKHEPLLDVTLPALPDDVSGEGAYRTAAARFRGHIALGPRKEFATAFQAFEAALARRRAPGPDEAFVRAVYPTQGLPLQARGLAMLGRNAEAEALIALSPRDCYECLRVRGLVAEGLGRPQQAQVWYAEAVRQAPRLARAYVDWARLLARHERFGSAERRLAKAAKLAPNWADPLKYWGDVLAAQGKREEALEKYDAALKLTPKWAELWQDRARLLSKN